MSKMLSFWKKRLIALNHSLPAGRIYRCLTPQEIRVARVIRENAAQFVAVAHWSSGAPVSLRPGDVNVISAMHVEVGPVGVPFETPQSRPDSGVAQAEAAAFAIWYSGHITVT